MARITKKELDEQNNVLLNDAKERMIAAQNQVYEANAGVQVAEAVLKHATEAYYAVERRIHPSKEGKSSAATGSK